MEIRKEQARAYLMKNGFKEDIIYPILNGYRSEKYHFSGILHANQPVLLRLRFGKPNGIDAWNLIDDKHMTQILEALYKDRALTEWVKIS